MSVRMGPTVGVGMTVGSPALVRHYGAGAGRRGSGRIGRRGGKAGGGGHAMLIQSITLSVQPCSDMPKDMAARPTPSLQGF